MGAWKPRLDGGLALVGTLVLAGYVIRVIPHAPNSFELALLIFAGAASIFSWISLWISWRADRRDAARVPRPDLSILVNENVRKRWRVEIELLEPRTNFSKEREAERGWLESRISRSNEPATLGSMFKIEPPLFWSDWMIGRYRGEVEEYLNAYETYLKKESAYEAFWKRSHPFVVAFTNERAGAPARGLRVILHLPKDDVSVLVPKEAPERIKKPAAPSPPDPTGALIRRPFVPEIVLHPIVDSEYSFGNVSSPLIRNDSDLEYEVAEVLHNLQEDTRANPVILSFHRPGRWTIPYEIHASNLPFPKRGVLTFEAVLADGRLREQSLHQADQSTAVR